MVEISRYLNVEKPTISRTVNRLESSGLIKRIPTTDKRERKITLTEKGNAVYQKAIEVVEAFEQELIKGISDEEREIALRTIMTLRKKLT